MSDNTEDAEHSSFVEPTDHGHSLEFREDTESSLKLNTKPDLDQSAAASSSSLQTFFILFKSFIGSAVFTLPYSYHKAGLGLSIIVTAFVGLLTLYCLLLVIKVADSMKSTGKITLEQLTQRVLGNKAKLSVEISIFTMQIGICIAVFILANQFLDYTFCGSETAYLCRNIYAKIPLFLVLTVPLSFINNASYFYVPSLIGTTFLLLTLSTQYTHYTGVIGAQGNAKGLLVEELTTFNLQELPMLFGVSTYCFEGIGTLFSIRGAMAQPQDFPRLLKIQMLVITGILVTFPAVCILALGDRLPEIVLFDLPRTQAFYLFIQVAIVVSNLISYPIQFFPAVKVMENNGYLKSLIFNDAKKTKNTALRYALRILLIAAILLIANLAKSFNLFLNLIGSCIFTYVGFVLPIWMYNVHFPEASKKKRIMNLVAAVFSIILGAGGAIMAFQKLITYKEEDIHQGMVL